MSVPDKNELLFQNGINFNDLPAWQKRGLGVRWTTYLKEAINPKTGEAVTAERRKLEVDLELLAPLLLPEAAARLERDEPPSIEAFFHRRHLEDPRRAQERRLGHPLLRGPLLVARDAVRQPRKK